MKIDTSHRENGDHPKLVVGFLQEKHTFGKQNHGNCREFRRKVKQQRQLLEIVEDFASEAKFLHFSSFFFNFFMFFCIFPFSNFIFFF